MDFHIFRGVAQPLTRKDPLRPSLKTLLCCTLRRAATGRLTAFRIEGESFTVAVQDGPFSALYQWISRVSDENSKHMGVWLIVMGYPKFAGWFIIWKIPKVDDDWGYPYDLGVSPTWFPKKNTENIMVWDPQIPWDFPCLSHEIPTLGVKLITGNKRNLNILKHSKTTLVYSRYSQMFSFVS